MIESRSSLSGDAGNPVGKFIKKFLFEIALLIIVIQLSLAASWGWTWMLLWNQIFSDIFTRIAAVIGTALLAGLITRVILKDHLKVMRWLSALISFTFSLVGISYLTRDQIGFRLTLMQPVETNWAGLWQFVSGGLITWLVINAWTKTRLSEAGEAMDATTTDLAAHNYMSESQYSIQVTPRVQTPQPQVRQPRRSHKSPSERQTGSNAGVPNAGRRGRGSRQSAIGITPVIQHVPVDVVISHKPSDKISKLVRRSAITRKKNPIRFMGSEEHRCPFCLEVVEENDLGGVVVCSICHANHHKRCWDVSGTCQVPHIQN